MNAPLDPSSPAGPGRPNAGATRADAPCRPAAAGPAPGILMHGDPSLPQGADVPSGPAAAGSSWRAAAVAASALAALLASGCQPKGEALELPGYIEADLTAVATPVGGTLAQLAVAEGQPVRQGDKLYVLESDRERAQLAEARARQLQAQAQSANVSKGAREAELDQLRAKLQSAKANLAQAETQLRKTEALIKQKFVAETQLDVDRTNVAVARAQVEDVRAALRAAKEGGRVDERAAAQAQAEAAQASVKQIEWLLQQKQVSAPITGVVQEVFIRPGEFAPTGSAVLSLLRTDSLRVRFFVPNDMRPRFLPGKVVAISVSGCSQPLQARVSRVSARPEYTQPLMFGPELRDRLSFLTEARIESRGGCSAPPGTPVGVRVPSGTQADGTAVAQR